jgi:hypothetical protein
MFLSVPLRSRVRERKNNFIESLYEVRSANYISNYTILSYLLKYPLFSYKYREVPVQLELLKLSKNKNYKLINGLKILEDLKLKSKGTNLSSLSKTTDYFIHTSRPPTERLAPSAERLRRAWVGACGRCCEAWRLLFSFFLFASPRLGAYFYP